MEHVDVGDPLPWAFEATLYAHAEQVLDLAEGSLAEAIGFATGRFRQRYGVHRGDRLSIVSAAEEAMNSYAAVEAVLMELQPPELRGHTFAGILEYGCGSTQVVLCGNPPTLFHNATGSHWLKDGLALDGLATLLATQSGPRWDEEALLAWLGTVLPRITGGVAFEA